MTCDIKVGFLKGEEKSSCRKIVVNTPHGERQVIEKFDYEDIEIDAIAFAHYYMDKLFDVKTIIPEDIKKDVLKKIIDMVK